MTPSSQLSQRTQALLYQWSVKEVKPRLYRLRLFALHTRLCAAACCLSRACLVPCGRVHHVVLCQQASQIAV